MKVAYLILNSFEFDTRARLEVEAIGRMGHDVEIIATVGGDSENYNGFPIHRIKQYTWPSRKIRFLQYNFIAARIAAGMKADLYHAVDLDVLSAARWAAKKTGGKLLYEARELYTELEPLEGRDIIKAIWRRLESKLIGKADKVITINESLGRELCERYGIDPPAIIRNVAIKLRDITPIDLRSKYDIPDDHKIILYQGVLRRGQGIHYLIEIMRHLEKTVVLFIGDGPIGEEIKRISVDARIENKVRFAGRVSPDELSNYTAAADSGILLMEDAALNNKLALPQKLFQYLNAGIPQIVSPMPEISGFVLKEKTGIVVQFGEPQKAASEISAFLFNYARFSETKENCEISARQNNWENESVKLVEIYRELDSNND